MRVYASEYQDMITAQQPGSGLDEVTRVTATRPTLFSGAREVIRPLEELRSAFPVQTTPAAGHSTDTLLGDAPTAAFATDIAQFKVAKGAVYLERGGKRLPAYVGTHLQATDTVVTGADGSAGITFIDNSLLSVGPNSVLQIERYAFNSTTHEGVFDTTLSRGTLSVVSGKIAKQSPDAMKVRTPSSILGVRGTEFLVRTE